MKRILSILLVCGSLSTQAQSSGDLPVVQQFASFNRNNIQEKIFVHTDKDFYLAGEIVWYKIYYMDGTFHRPLDLSKLAYVEIIDQNNKPVMQAKNAIKNSTGKGSFYLPSSVSSGNFKLRAYTNWMKNSDAGYFFEKNICIVNSLKPLNLPSAAPAKKYEVQFFPEGGNLVNDLENRIAFKVNDQFGSGVECSGLIADEKGDTLIRFPTFKFGMGSFLFKPAAGHNYKAILTTTAGNLISKDLPLATTSGYIMRANENAGTITITVSTNLVNKMNGGEIFLLAHTRQTIRQAEKKTIENGSANFIIKKDGLGEGISHVTIFNSEQQPVCERLLFQAPKNALKLKASTSSVRIARRNKVDVDISTDFDGKAVPTKLSLSVYQVDSLSGASVPDMQTYLLLTSDLRGSVESPSYYFSNNTEAITAADNLMMTQGWRRFNWNQPFRKTATTPKFPPEFDGHLVGATITYNKGQQPVAGAKAYLSVPGTKTQFYPSMTDQEGKAYFDIRDYYGKNELVVQTEVLKDSNYRIDISDPFSDRYSDKPLLPFNIDRSQANTIINHSVAVQTLNAYMNDSLTRFDLPVLDSSPFYGRYSKRYLLDDYVRFTTMEEVLREYVPEVGIRRTSGQSRLRISDWEQTKYLDGEPLLLLDGVPVTHKQILSYDPMKVRTLEVVTNRYISGKFVFDGIASFTSYAGNMPEFVFDPKTVILDYEGLQLEREFYAPVYETESQKSSRLPDFRDLLTWQPDLQTNAAGKTKVQFYTSDRTGNFVGIIHGIDAQGNAATQVFNIQVTK
ncbi:hypothetical protein [Flavitalea sp.]|nr:hypothetical protein [Flavitalea sp.]